MEKLNGHGIFDASLKGASSNTVDVDNKKQPKLTDKGKFYKLAQFVRERKKLKREMQAHVANIEILMGLNKNFELVSQECIKLNERLSCLEIFVKRYKSC